MQKTEEVRATLINLFEGKIVCADCGKKMYFHRKRIDKDKRGRWYAYYECSTSVGRRYEHCTSHYTRQDTLEANVLAAIHLACILNGLCNRYRRNLFLERSHN